MSVIGTESVEVAVLSDCGRVRSGNEDAFGYDVAQGIYVVCDGMGGAAAGEVASRIAVQTILEQWRKDGQSPTADTETAPTTKSTAAGKSRSRKTARAQTSDTSDAEVRDRLRAVIQEANKSIHRRAMKDLRLNGMGTTAVVLYMQRNASGATVWLAHAGDSRAYRWRAGVLRQMTIDHSLVEEQVRLGHITVKQAESSPFRNVITRAVGAAPTVEADVLRDVTEPGDIYLLCSDGLTRELSEAQISAIIARHEHSNSQAAIRDACNELVHSANEHGGRDNITCILVRIG